MTESAYPLAWPPGWPRAKNRASAAFRHYRDRVPVDVAIRRLSNELERLGAEHPVLSTNCQRRVNGELRLSPAPSDPGVACYFTFRGYLALEDLSNGVPWRRILGFAENSTPACDEVERKYRARMREVHPDASQQSNEQAIQLNRAIEEARAELRGAQ
jgi:hypothetical protein